MAVKKKAKKAAKADLTGLERARQTVFLHPENDIEPDPDQPRTHFDEDKLASIQANMASEGLNHPITVRPNPKKGKRRKPFMLVVGERRWRSACNLKWNKIEAFVEEDASQALFAQLGENLHREDLSAVEEGRGYQRAKRDGWTVAQIHERLGVSEFHIHQQIKLLRLHRDLQQRNVEGRLTAQVGYMLVDTRNCRTQAEQLTVVRELSPDGEKRITAKALQRCFDARKRRRDDRKGASGRGRLPKVSRTVLKGIGPAAKTFAEYLEEFAGAQGTGELDMGFFQVWRKFDEDERAALLTHMSVIHDRSSAFIRFFAAHRKAAIGASRKAAHKRSNKAKNK